MSLQSKINNKGVSGAWECIYNDKIRSILGSTGIGLSIIANSTGPTLTIKGITGGNNINVECIDNDIKIDNSSPASSVSLTSLGGSSLVVGVTGPSMSLHGLSSGTGISIADVGTTLQITNDSPASSVSLSSLGGSSIVVGGTGPTMSLHGLSSGTGISIADVGTTLEITNDSPASSVTLTSVGGSSSLVQDGTGAALGVRGLTAGTGISVTQNATDVTIETNDDASVFEYSSGDVVPNTANANYDVNANLLFGGSHTLSGTNNQTLILGGNNNTITNANNSAIISGTNNTLRGDACGVIGGNSNNISTSTNSFAGGGNLNNITSINNTSVSGGNNNTITSVNNSSMDSCENCNLLGSRTNRSSIKSSNNCNIRTTGGGGAGDQCAIIASTNCDIGSAVTGRVAGDHMTIIGSQNVDISYWGTGTTSTVAAFNGLPFSTAGGGSNMARVFIAGGSNGQIASGNTLNSAIFGSNWSSQHAGHFMFTDPQGGATHTTFGQNTFSVRSSGGARFLSNTANTSGVLLGAGGNSWAAISDVNKKENLVNLDDVVCNEICKKIVGISLYKYNYIGNPEKQICYGPTAQDWHSTFGCENIDIPRFDYTLDEDGNINEVPVLDEDGNQIIDTKPAKDPLTIETMDYLGLLMATVKDLNRRISILENGGT